MPGLVTAITAAADDDFRLGADGVMRWAGSEVATLKGDRDVLVPAIQPVAADGMEPADRDRLVARLRGWLDQYLRSRLGPLFQLREAELGSHGRGLAFQLADGLGFVPRDQVRSHLNDLPSGERKALRALGVNFGRFALSLPELSKPEAVRLRALLWCVHKGHPVPNLPARRGRSVPDDPAAPEGFYAAVGFVKIARRLIPVRLFDRVADAAASALRRGRLTASPQLATYADLTLGELRQALALLGYRKVNDAEGEHFRPGRRNDGQPRHRRPQQGDSESREANGKDGKGHDGKGRRGRPRHGKGAHGADARAPDGNGQAGNGQGRNGKGRPGKDGRDRSRSGSAKPSRPREIDPDSPFAVLKNLTFGDRKT